MPVKLETGKTWGEVADMITNRIIEAKIDNKFEPDKFKRWFMAREKLGLRFDYILIHRAYKIWQNLQNEGDHFSLIVGDEGTGKSTLGAQFCAWISPNMNLEDISYNMKSYVKKLKEIASTYKIGEIDKEDKSVLLDEGGIDLYSRDAMKLSNRILSKTFMVQRFLNIHTCICLPHYWSLDKFVRNHRIKTLIIIPERGAYKCITGKGIKAINRCKDIEMQTPLNKISVPYGYFWEGHFRKDFPDTLDKSEYEKRKLKYIASFLDEVDTETEQDPTKAPFVPLKVVASELGVHPVTLNEKVRNGSIKGVKFGNIWKIPQNEVQSLRENGFSSPIRPLKEKDISENKSTSNNSEALDENIKKAEKILA